MTASIPNVLAQRYASPAITSIWSPEGRVRGERALWLAVLKSQRELGLPIADGVVEAFEAAKDHIDLDSIEAREAVTRHDVKARIEEFCALAGTEGIHQGMTSRDLTENVEQWQVLESAKVIRTKALAALLALGKRAREYQDLVITARTHNVAAQPTTLGRRLAMFGEELLVAWEAFDHLVDHYPARGLKGAVGTQMDSLNLLQDPARVAELEQRIVDHLGFGRVLDAPGQVYPRSLDFAVISALYQMASGPASLVRTIRLMAGHELASEGFLPGQVGSSAMPHKMNSRSCERIDGLHLILRGHLTMAAGLAGDQWNEGDVSCSVVRRVCLPDAFYAIDGLLETLLTVLNQMRANEVVIERENQHYQPFLLTTTVLMAAVQKGVGRETAHEVIKEHAMATVEAMREGKVDHNDLFARLASDSRLGMEAAELDTILKAGSTACGLAKQQTDAWLARLEPLAARFPDAVDYQPGAIL